MDFSFFSRPAPRKFNYKPRYYKPEEDEKLTDNQNVNDFGNRLHRGWESKRVYRSRKGAFPLKSLIWLIFIVFVLIFFVVKLF